MPWAFPEINGVLLVTFVPLSCLDSEDSQKHEKYAAPTKEIRKMCYKLRSSAHLHSMSPLVYGSQVFWVGIIQLLLCPMRLVLSANLISLIHEWTHDSV